MSDSPERVLRKTVSSYFRRSWLGEDFTSKTYCPIALPGLEFDVDRAAHTAPFTPAEVRGSGATAGVGYVVLRIVPVDRYSTGATGGMQGSGLDARFVTEYHTRVNLEFLIHVPSRASESIEERYADAIRALFEGIAFRPEGSTLKSIRQHSRWPVRQRSAKIDNGAFRTTFVDVPLETVERRPNAGLQEAP